jgi:Zn-dependent peptidase ImmA (M78 family)
LAHELVHYKQDIQNRLTPESGKTGHEHENEANAAAAIMMRNFAQMRPEMFIVK